MTSTLEHKVDRRALLRGRWRKDQNSIVLPPGAIPAEGFYLLCDGCAKCADACPADAIVMTAPGTKLADATPQILAAEAPCVMCDGLVCAPACPTGALLPVTPETMKIATAVFSADACWARQGLDPDCDYCFDRCPLRGSAITYRRGDGPTLIADSCTGCGCCVHFCPAQPKAMAVVPL